MQRRPSRTSPQSSTVLRLSLTFGVSVSFTLKTNICSPGSCHARTLRDRHVVPAMLRSKGALRRSDDTLGDRRILGESIHGCAEVAETLTVRALLTREIRSSALHDRRHAGAQVAIDSAVRQRVALDGVHPAESFSRMSEWNHGSAARQRVRVAHTER